MVAPFGSAAPTHALAGWAILARIHLPAGVMATDAAPFGEMALGVAQVARIEARSVKTRRGLARRARAGNATHHLPPMKDAANVATTAATTISDQNVDRSSRSAGTILPWIYSRRAGLGRYGRL